MPVVRDFCSIVRRSRLISDYAIAQMDPIYNAVSFVYRLHIIVGRYTLVSALSCCCASLDFALSIRHSYLARITVERTQMTFITYRFEFESSSVFFPRIGIEVTARRNNSAVIGKKKKNEEERSQCCSEKYDPAG